MGLNLHSELVSKEGHTFKVSPVAGQVLRQITEVYKGRVVIS